VQWRNQKSLKIPKGNQNPYIEDAQTKQWPKENVQKDKHKIYTSGSQCTFNRNIRIQNEEKCSSNMSSDGIDDNLAFEEIHLNENGYHQIKGKMETTDLFE
jgi:hypothetical protein